MYMCNYILRVHSRSIARKIDYLFSMIEAYVYFKMLCSLFCITFYFIR